jgi:hypothetical protein
LDDNETLDGNIIQWIIVYYGKNLRSGEELITWALGLSLANNFSPKKKALRAFLEIIVYRE